MTQGHAKKWVHCAGLTVGITMLLCDLQVQASDAHDRGYALTLAEDGKSKGIDA